MGQLAVYLIPLLQGTEVEDRTVCTLSGNSLCTHIVSNIYTSHKAAAEPESDHHHPTAGVDPAERTQ